MVNSRIILNGFCARILNKISNLQVTHVARSPISQAHLFCGAYNERTTCGKSSNACMETKIKDLVIQKFALLYNIYIIAI